MDNQTIVKLNQLINEAYECSSFAEFLKLSILKLHELVMYDSAVFFCAISRDCSFFKPYLGGSVGDYYAKEHFAERESYLKQREESVGKEALVFKAQDYRQGVVQIDDEPRSGFLSTQEVFSIACMRIVYRGQFLGEIYLHRNQDKPDFSQHELFLLRLLQPHVSTVFHIIHTLTAIKQLEGGGGQTAKKGLCLLDSDLSIVTGNSSGLEMLKTPTVFGSSVLYHVKECCEDLLTEVKGGQHRHQLRQAKKLSIKTRNGQLQAEIVVKSEEQSSAQKSFFVLLEYEEEQKISEYKFKFSKREADIIDGLIQGKNNSQLAKALNLSENTIKTHIQNIYRKAGASNRTELVYILMLNK